MNDVYEPVSVTMTPQQKSKIALFGRKMGYSSISASLRRIVDEWWELRGRQLVTTDELVLISPSVEVKDE